MVVSVPLNAELPSHVNQQIHLFKLVVIPRSYNLRVLILFGKSGKQHAGHRVVRMEGPRMSPNLQSRAHFI